MVNQTITAVAAATRPQLQNLQEVTKLNPCPHCEKPDWCYRLGDLTVCNRDSSPAHGWECTAKKDGHGKPYYAPSVLKKPPRPKGRQEYTYHDQDGKPTVKVTRVDDGEGTKRIFQSHWNGDTWITGLPGAVKATVLIYRYPEVRKAISEGKTIFVVEGEGLVDLLWERNLPATTTIGGAGKSRAYGNFKANLEGAKLVLCPDRDKPGLQHMDDIFEEFPNAKWLYAPPSDFYWSHLPPSGGLDLKDWVESGATVKDILAAIEDRRVVVDMLNRTLEKEAATRRIAATKTEQKLNMIQSVWGERLRWNILKKVVELDGERLFLDHINIRVALEAHIDISNEAAKAIVLTLAYKNPYSPVVEYLDQVSNDHQNPDVSILDTMAVRYFDSNDPLHAAIMKRTMIAAVARAYHPGSKHDNITILQGKQGTLKSTFWEVLAGERFFTDDMNGTEKDEIMKLSQYWMLEYAEFENAYKKKDVSQLKAFLSRRQDSMRRPYGSDIEDFPRPSILVGSTNQDDFLHDPTGERRFWVIKVLVNRIPIPLLRKERDYLWASAVAAYRSGEQWHLTDEENAWLEEANKQFTSSDPWESVVMMYAEGKTEVTITDILFETLRIEVAKQSKAEQNRVAAILRSHGWTSGNRKRVRGQLVRPWLPPEKVEQGVKGEFALHVEQPQTSIREDLERECSTRSTESPQNEAEILLDGGGDSSNKTSSETAAILAREVEPVEHDAETVVQSEQESVPHSPVPPSLLSKLLAAWDDIAEIGKLVLSAANADLYSATEGMTAEEIAHLRGAARKSWRPGVNRKVSYDGECCEVINALSGSRDIEIQLKSGRKLKVKLSQVAPWLSLPEP